MFDFRKFKIGIKTDFGKFEQFYLKFECCNAKNPREEVTKKILVLVWV